MASQYITVETEDGPMPTYESTPEGQSRGAVVVVQEAFASRATSRASRCASPTPGGARWPRHSSTGRARRSSATTTSRGRAVMGQLSAEGITAERARALDFLAADGVAPGATGIVGFCMAGRLVLRSDLRPLGARSPSTAAGCAKGVSVSPRSSSSPSPSLQTPWLGLYGDQDKGIPAEDVEGCARPPKTHRLRRGRALPDAEHGSTAMTGRASRAGSRRRVAPDRRLVRRQPRRLNPGRPSARRRPHRLF